MVYCSYRGFKIFFEDHGTGIPIVFIHPPGMGRKVFHYQRLLANQFRVILPDLSGHGDTIGIQEDVSIRNFADEVFALINHLRLQKVIVCGYSSGGVVAQEIALTYPERVKALILSGGFPKINMITLKYEHLLGMYVLKKYPKLIRYAIATAHASEREIRRSLLQHMEKANPSTWYKFYEQSLAYDCFDRLGQLEMPLYLIYGSRDFVKGHSKMYEHVKKVEITVIDKAYHQLPMKNWRIFNDLVKNYVTNLSASQG